MSDESPDLSSPPPDADLPDMEGVIPVPGTEDAPPEVPGPPAAPPKPSRSRYERREQASADALRGLIRDYIMEKFPRLMEGSDPLSISLVVELTPGEPGELCFTPDLRRQLSDQLAEAAAPPAEFREGSVFNFQSETNDDPACRPGDTTQVFCGFDNMGRPRWQSHAQWLLDHKDPDVDRLHQGGGRPVARVQMGKELKAEQLGSYGRASKEYCVLGQLTAGYFRLPPAFARMAGDERLALSFQVVETRVKGDFALRLNTLAGGLLPVELNDLLQEPAFRDLGQARERALVEIRDLEGRARAALAKKDTPGFQEVMRRVPRLLNAFRSALEGGGNRTSRGPRDKPHKPMDDEWKADAREATVQELFYDVPRDSWLLLGARGKAHVFTATGKHLSSFPVGPDLIEKRIVSERWVGGKPESDSVLSAIRQAAG